MIGLLNHSYKILSIYLLQRLIKETEWFLSEWQASFRGNRGCRDNSLLLRVIYDNIIKGKTGRVVTYIDFAAVFDSVSHKYLDRTLQKAGVSHKPRSMFCTIYRAAEGSTRIRGVEGNTFQSETFSICEE